VARRFLEMDACADHARMILRERVGVQEKTDAAAGLGSDGGGLVGSVGFGEQNAGLCAFGGHKHPAFCRREAGVLDQIEAEGADLEGDASVIVWHHKGKG
jgi:hypothetical protein